VISYKKGDGKLLTVYNMQQDRISILSTRPLAASIIDDAALLQVDIDVQSFIETEAIQSVEVQQEIEQALLQAVTVVFTSMTAVEAVASYLIDTKPEWTIYCMGNTTQQLVEKYFGKESIAATAGNAAELAEQIVEDSFTEEILFFCGDQRRDELPGILNDHAIDVTEIMVYHTVATPHTIQRMYHGILFFSPSAVNSFFSVNKVGAQTTLFAIGPTTAAAIKKRCGNSIIVGDSPGKESLVDKAINYFVNNER
jgi:uroporphyrinogen-III synthase